MVRLWLALSFSLLLCCSSSGGNDAEVPGGPEAIARNLVVPWALDFLPNGEIIFTERSGDMGLITNGSIRSVGTIDVLATGESGLLGIAVDPAFNESGFVYVYYTVGDGQMRNRVSRFTLDEELVDEVVLLDSIPASSIHNGGRIHFGPDALLYITTGDAGDPSRSGDTANLGGKILRMRPNGSVPQDNPFGNYVFALGLRNPQGLAWHGTRLYATDHGPTRLDRILRIEKGVDYGWPQTCTEIPAFKCYTDFTLAPSGAAIIGDVLYVAGLRGQQLRAVNLVTGTETMYLTDLGRLRGVVARDGFLYITTSNRDGRGEPQADDDRILRVLADSLRD